MNRPMQSALFRATTKRARRPYSERNPYVDYSRPNKRWCIVGQCSECHRMAHDCGAYRSHTFSRNGTLIGTPPRSLPYWFYSGERGVCNDCSWHSRQVCPVDVCEGCGRIRRASAVGVDRRYDCSVEKPRYFTPKLCVSCWNKRRAVLRTAKFIESIHAQITQITRERRSASRGH